jgi:hypothetical protein
MGPAKKLTPYDMVRGVLNPTVLLILLYMICTQRFVSSSGLVVESIILGFFLSP